MTGRLTMERTREKLLASPARARLLAYIEANPGSSLATLLTDLGFASGMLYHHLHMLANAGIVHVQTVGARRFVWPVPEGAVAGQIAFPSPPAFGRTRRRIAEAIAEGRGGSIRELAIAVGETERVVYYHVRHLLDDGFIEPSGRLRRRNLRPTARLLETLSHVTDEGALDSA